MTKHLKSDWIYARYIVTNCMVSGGKGGMLPLLALELHCIVVA